MSDDGEVQRLHDDEVLPTHGGYVLPLHDDEVHIDLDLVGELIARALPRWRSEPLSLPSAQGTDNVIVRLGTDLVVRLPRTPTAAESLERELAWLPVVAPHLGVPVPQVVAIGESGDGYPFRWCVVTWLPGQPVVAGRAGADLALELAATIRRLRSAPPPPAEALGSLTHYRAGSVLDRDEETRAALAECDGLLDVEHVGAVWQQIVGELSRTSASRSSTSRPATWLHADLQPGNLLSQRGRLAVLDWGSLSFGDPSVDLIPAWNLLTADERPLFREALDVSDAEWAAGRAWALSIGIVALPYYAHSNRALADISRYQIDQVVRKWDASS